MRTVPEVQHYVFAPKPTGRAPGRPARRYAAPTPWPGSPLPHAEAARLLDRERSRLRIVRAGIVAEGLDEAQADSAGELAHTRQHLADTASDTYQREVDESLLAGVDAQLAELDAAVVRLAARSYGRCDRCGRPISSDRLRAEPATRWCLADMVTLIDGQD